MLLAHWPHQASVSSIARIGSIVRGEGMCEACQVSLNGTRSPSDTVNSATLLRFSPWTSTGVRSHTESGPAMACSAPSVRRTHGTIEP
jgi:hypothetical protein